MGTAFIPDPGSEFFHPGSKRFQIPDPNLHQRILVFLTNQIVPKLSELLSGMSIPDPELDFFTHPGSRL
jgi:hypothetical protein